MLDKEIIDLYLKRDEQAILETQNSYGSFCYHISMNILGVHEDAEECVSDTFWVAWSQIPPTIPEFLPAFLGRITKNISISRLRKAHAKKRYSGIDVSLSELEDCIPASAGADDQYDSNFLSSTITEWLESLHKREQMLFVRRYWYGDSIPELSQKSGIATAKLSQILFKLRKSLRKHLQMKGVIL